MEISEINTSTKEGKLLIIALAALTVSPSICINKEMYDGRTLASDEVLNKILVVSDFVYGYLNN